MNGTVSCGDILRLRTAHVDDWSLIFTRNALEHYVDYPEIIEEEGTTNCISDYAVSKNTNINDVSVPNQQQFVKMEHRVNIDIFATISR